MIVRSALLLQYRFFLFASIIAIPSILICFNAGSLRTDQLDALHFSTLSIANVANAAGSTNATLTSPWGYLAPSATITNRQASLIFMAVDFTIITLFLLFSVFVQLMITRGERRAPECVGGLGLGGLRYGAC